MYLGKAVSTVLCGIGLSIALSDGALAQCSAPPNNLTNGQVTDATQVMGNFNHLTTCLNSGQLTVPPVSSLTVPKPGGGTYTLGLPTGPGVSGQFLSTDGTGQTSWASSSGGGGPTIPPVNAPIAATFTTTLGSPVSKTDVTGIGVLVDAGAWGTSDRLAGYGIALPTTPYYVDIGLRNFGLPNAFNLAGLYISDGTKIVTFSVCPQLGTNQSPSLKVDNWTNTTSFSSEPYGKYSDIPEILRLYDDGTNFNFYASKDGYSWTPIYQVSRTAFLTPTSVGVVMSPNKGSISNVPPGNMTGLLTYWSVH